jgi:hypothetical protein
MKRLKDKITVVMLCVTFSLQMFISGCAVFSKQGSREGQWNKKIPQAAFSCPSLQTADTDGNGIIDAGEAKQYNIAKTRIFGLNRNHPDDQERKADFERVENVLREGGKGFEELTPRQKTAYGKWHNFILSLEVRHRKAVSQQGRVE